MRAVGRFLSSLIGIVAIFFGARSALLLHSVWSVQNYIPAPRDPDSCPVCPTQTIFDIETQQILVILASAATLAIAWLTWRKS
jgi:hypothetical protein